MFLQIRSTLNISTTATYTLTNSYSASPLAVDPTLSDLQLRAASDNDTALEFQFRTSDDVYKYNICAAYQNATYCLDVFGDAKTTPHLAAPGEYSGQYWTVTSSDGSVILSNDYTGSDWYLDVFSSTLQCQMSYGTGYSGQSWILNQVSTNITLPADALETATSTNSAAVSSHGLSTGALVGITLAGGTIIALTLLGIFALIFIRHRRQHTPLAQANPKLEDPSEPSSTPSHYYLPPHQLDPDRAELHTPSTLTPLSATFQHPPQAHEQEQHPDIHELPAEVPPPPVSSEKNAQLLSWPASPASSAAARHTARWEEVVLDENGRWVSSETGEHWAFDGEERAVRRGLGGGSAHGSGDDGGNASPRVVSMLGGVSPLGTQDAASGLGWRSGVEELEAGPLVYEVEGNETRVYEAGGREVLGRREETRMGAGRGTGAS